jgi:hypothetical protein
MNSFLNEMEATAEAQGQHRKSCCHPYSYLHFHRLLLLQSMTLKVQVFEPLTALLIRTQRKPGWLPRAWEILMIISVCLLQIP